MSEKVAETTLPSLPHRQESNSSVNEKDAHSSDDSSLEVHNEKEGVDVVVGLIGNHVDDPDITPEVSKQIRRKLDWTMLPLLIILYTLQFIDKNSVANAQVLGIMTATHLTADQFNNLTTAFYAGYICFVLPHAFAMQKLPIAKYISTNIFIWAILIGLQPVCTNYAGLFACRFLLGASEGCITTGVMTLITMFYTRIEATERLGWTFQCNGIASIIAGFISFGVAHISLDAHPRPWQWLMIIIAILSVLTSCFWFWRMPDNPAAAKFLTEDEKVKVVRRIQINQNGVETKVWKKHQFIEAFMDPKTWLFFLFAAVADIQGGIGVEYGVILKGLGFDTLQTTLLGIPSGGVMIISITVGMMLLRTCKSNRTYLGMFGFLPGVIGCICLLTLPWSDKTGLLIQFYLIQTGGLGFVMVLALCSINTAGHTKKMTTNAIFFVGYCIGQMLCTQFWKVQYRPRNTVPWAIQLSSYVFDIGVIYALRLYFQYLNRKRDAEKLASGKEYEEYGYVEHVNEDGSVVKMKVPIQFMDVTDWENKAFRYAL
jgi:hypothetical protein